MSERKVLHITVGDDDWEPTSEELQALIRNFQNTPLNPTDIGTLDLNSTEIN
jgi:hypothetical protein